MNEVARKARNAQRLQELYPVFARRIAVIITDLEADGYRPRIQDAWRSPESQLAAYSAGNSKLKFGYHNVTAPNGDKEALAVDLLDDDFPLNSRSDYLLRLAGAAAKYNCGTGVKWGLPPVLQEAVEAAIQAHDWKARLKIGWDPTHVEPTDVTVGQAKSGIRPKEAAAVASRVRTTRNAKVSRSARRKPERR